MIQTGPVNSLGPFNEWENRIDCADGRLVAGGTGVFQHATDHVASGNVIHCVRSMPDRCVVLHVWGRKLRIRTAALLGFVGGSHVQHDQPETDKIEQEQK